MVRSLLITGGCGFLGSQLIRDLALDERLGALSIRILDNVQDGHYRALMNLPAPGHYQFIEGDILDPDVVRLALKGVDTVVHLAAIVRTPMSFDNPTWIEQVNHWGTAHLIEACIEAGVSRFIFTSSTAVYGPRNSPEENELCRPQGPYAQSKYRAEKSVVTASERGLQTVIIRLGTLFGLAPVTRFDAVVNRLAYLAGIQRSLTVYGDGQQRRPLIHVRDASSAIRYFLADSNLLQGKAVNGVGLTACVSDIVDIIRRLKPDTDVRFTDQDIRTHLSFEASNAALTALGWQPQVSLQSGIAELLAQFRNFERLGFQQIEAE
jgi:UDP-glucose 4-epimerase